MRRFRDWRAARAVGGRGVVIGVLLVGTLVVAACGSSNSGSTAKSVNNSEPLKIGVPLPLSGAQAAGAGAIRVGMEFAVKEANAAGGVLGHPLELLVEDNKGEAGAAAAVATKLVTDDKVFAIVGGLGSTADIAMLQSVAQYEPIFVHAGAQAVKIEEQFGDKNWYFHAPPWDYYRQASISAFIAQLDPVPQSVAIAHEDSLFGTDAATAAKSRLSEAGVRIAFTEAFKAGAPDLSALLNRVKADKPDVFLFIGTGPDNVLMARQSADLGASPKLTVIIQGGQQRADFGATGDGIVVSDLWHPSMKVDGLDQWKKAFADATGSEATSANVQGYTAMSTLIQAIKAGGSIKRDDVLAALASTEFWTPYGKARYRPSQHGGIHQLLTDENYLIVQYTPQNETLVVWPKDRANAAIIYPASKG